MAQPTNAMPLIDRRTFLGAAGTVPLLGPAVRTLGADPPRIRRMVVGEGLLLVAAGAGLGLLGAMAATRVLSTLLYGIAASDPVSYVLATAAAVAAGLAGSYVPARRASRTDAAVVLRGE